MFVARAFLHELAYKILLEQSFTTNMWLFNAHSRLTKTHGIRREKGEGTGKKGERKKPCLSPQLPTAFFAAFYLIFGAPS
jgi:hypothetical protein